MRHIVFIVCVLFVSTAFAQCPGGTCQRPVQAAKSVVAAPAKAVQSVAVQKPVRKLFKGRLFRRWR